MKNTIAEGFGYGIGGMGAVIVFVCVSLLFFVPGVLMLASQRKLPKNERSTGVMVLAYILLFLGMITGGGMGGSFVFGNLMSNAS